MTRSRRSSQQGKCQQQWNSGASTRPATSARPRIRRSARIGTPVKSPPIRRRRPSGGFIVSACEAILSLRCLRPFRCLRLIAQRRNQGRNPNTAILVHEVRLLACWLCWLFGSPLHRSGLMRFHEIQLPVVRRPLGGGTEANLTGKSGGNGRQIVQFGGFLPQAEARDLRARPMMDCGKLLVNAPLRSRRYAQSYAPAIGFGPEHKCGFHATD